MTHISGSRLIPGSVQREKQFIIDFVFNLTILTRDLK